MSPPTATPPPQDHTAHHHTSDVVVVGAGVFGCAIAVALADQGRSVILLERWLREPDRIVGELLQPGGLASLLRLGLGACVDGIDAIPVRGYNVVYHGRPVAIPYPAVDAHGAVLNEYGPRPPALHDNSPLKEIPTGRSFHHGRFIVKLRDACLAHPNITVVEAEAKGPIRGDAPGEVLGVEALTTSADKTAKTREYFFGGLTIACDGYNSVFRKQFLPAATPQVRSKFYGLELLDCPLPVPHHGTVVIGPNSEVVLLYQIGARETRMLVDVPLDCPAAAPAVGGVRAYIRDVAIPSLPEAVRASALAALAATPAVPRSMPNSYMPARRQRPRGLVVLGDALNMRHPLTGGGMTVALNDAEVLAAELAAVSDLADRAAVARAVDALYTRRKALTGNINVLAQALYSLFAADDWQLRVLQRGCFEYFERRVTDGPVGLLAGLIHRPAVLTWHFFTVAFVAIGMHMREMGAWLFPVALVHAVMILWKACVVFLPVMFTELT